MSLICVTRKTCCHCNTLFPKKCDNLNFDKKIAPKQNFAQHTRVTRWHDTDQKRANGKTQRCRKDIIHFWLVGLLRPPLHYSRDVSQPFPWPESRADYRSPSLWKYGAGRSIHGARAYSEFPVPGGCFFIGTHSHTSLRKAYGKGCLNWRFSVRWLWKKGRKWSDKITIWE